MPATTTSMKALAGVALAALSVGVWASADVPPLAVLPLGVACVALALLGLRDIRRSDGRLGGRWLATGAVVAEVVAAVYFAGLVPAARYVREQAQSMKEV